MPASVRILIRIHRSPERGPGHVALPFFGLHPAPGRSTRVQDLDHRPGLELSPHLRFRNGLPPKLRIHDDERRQTVRQKTVVHPSGLTVRGDDFPPIPVAVGDVHRQVGCGEYPFDWKSCSWSGSQVGSVSGNAAPCWSHLLSRRGHAQDCWAEEHAEGEGADHGGAVKRSQEQRTVRPTRTPGGVRRANTLYFSGQVYVPMRGCGKATEARPEGNGSAPWAIAWLPRHPQGSA